MSYKHALALTAFGIGAVLQGCGEDEEKTCTVNCEDKCKDITDYTKLEKSSTYETDCGMCIGNRLDSVEGDDLDTDIKKWQKALADAVLTDATDAQKALPVQALQYCGAKQHDAACGTPVDPVDHVSTKDGIDAAVATIAANHANCGLCYLLVDVTDCATGLKSLSDCGNAPELVCEQDYSCHDIAGAYDDLAPDDAENTVCKTCLDAEVKADADITQDTYLAAWEATADAAALADHLLHCGAEQEASCSTDDVNLVATTGEALLTEIHSENAGLCEVCVLMGEFVDVDAPTCREIKTSLAACGDADALTDVKCPECALFVVDDEDCKTCLKEQNSDTAWEAPELTDQAASYAPWLKIQTCGAVVADTACPALEWTGLGDAAVATFQSAVSELDAGCNACINVFMAENGDSTVTCANFEAARVACSVAGSAKACS